MVWTVGLEEKPSDSDLLPKAVDKLCLQVPPPIVR